LNFWRTYLSYLSYIRIILIVLIAYENNLEYLKQHSMMPIATGVTLES
jgi:hypothetical protein